jgi:hypothetical protein
MSTKNVIISCVVRELIGIGYTHDKIDDERILSKEDTVQITTDNNMIIITIL